MGKKQFLCTSHGIVHPNGTGQNGNDKPLYFFFLPSVTMCQHCSLCVVDRLARAFILSLRVHVLFHSKRRALLTSYSDWQAPLTCLIARIHENQQKKLKSFKWIEFSLPRSPLLFKETLTIPQPMYVSWNLELFNSWHTRKVTKINNWHLARSAKVIISSKHPAKCWSNFFLK